MKKKDLTVGMEVEIKWRPPATRSSRTRRPDTGLYKATVVDLREHDRAAVAVKIDLDGRYVRGSAGGEILGEIIGLVSVIRPWAEAEAERAEREALAAAAAAERREREIARRDAAREALAAEVEALTATGLFATVWAYPSYNITGEAGFGVEATAKNRALWAALVAYGYESHADVVDFLVANVLRGSGAVHGLLAALRGDHTGSDDWALHTVVKTEDMTASVRFVKLVTDFVADHPDKVAVLAAEATE